MAAGSRTDHMTLALETVQAVLESEHAFFEAVRTELRKVAPLSEFPTVSSPNGMDYVLQLTRFLFFLDALNCTDAEKVSRFIDLHNAKVESDIADPGYPRSLVEARKAIIRPERKAKIVETVGAFGRPIFAIYDYGHFLIENMSPKTTEKLIEDLRYGGLLVRREDHRIDADQKRVLIESTGLLQHYYVASLLQLRRDIAGNVGVSVAEEETDQASLAHRDR
ncbi:hypothetical protein DLJ49_00645 [Rhodovulum sp. 12E13]|nr:hypothetical protein DLJ49_00645 [Rhodovulum sp. 12E13]